MFGITHDRETLGETRLKAERFLMNVLGIDQTTMCALNYSVSAPASVNAQFASIDNLGFSYCKGSVRLP
jgi:hypothetical protein